MIHFAHGFYFKSICILGLFNDKALSLGFCLLGTRAPWGSYATAPTFLWILTQVVNEHRDKNHWVLFLSSSNLCGSGNIVFSSWVYFLNTSSKNKDITTIYSMQLFVTRNIVTEIMMDTVCINHLPESLALNNCSVKINISSDGCPWYYYN